MVAEWSKGVVVGQRCAEPADAEHARLSELLAEAADCRVQVVADGPANGRGAVPATTLRWWDGPTVTGMRAVVGELRDGDLRFGTAPWCYEHRLTAWGRTLGVLLWLNEDPARVQLQEAVVAQMAAEQIEYPERCAPAWQKRASGLLSLGPDGRAFTLAALRLLLQCARADGWAGAGAWLDSLDGGTRASLRLVR